MTMLGKDKRFVSSSFDRLFRFLVSVIFLLGLLPMPVLAAGTGTIAGQVTDNVTAGNISGATILIFAAGSQTPTLTGSTNATGGYTIATPSATNYRVSAVKSGYISGEVNGINVSDNVTTTVNFTLSPGGIIQGTVSDNVTQGAIAGANVVAFKPETPATIFSSPPTDASGHYSLTAPPGAGYTVQVTKQGYVSENQTGVSAVVGTPATVNFSLKLPPDTTPPAAVTNLATSNPTNNSVTLTWTAPGDDNTTGTAVQYDIRYANAIIDDNTKFGNATQAASIPAPHVAGTPETFNVTGLNSNTTYFFAIKTKDDANLWSVLSNSPSANTTAEAPPSDTTPPATVNNLATSNATSNSVTLNWTAPGDDNTTGTAAQYDIRYANAIIDDNTKFGNATQATNIPAPHVAGTPETFNVTGLSSNTTYFFAIKTKDDANLWSALSNSPSANTTAGAPQGATFNIVHSQNKFSFMLGAGDNITETINVVSVNGFQGTVNLNLGGPPGIQTNSTVSPNQVTLSAGQTQSVTMTLRTDVMMPSGTYQCGLNGQTDAYGGQQKGYFFTVIIGVAGQPLLSASPSVVAAGAQTNFFVSQFTPSANVTLQWDSGPRVGQTLASGQIAGDGTWNAQVTIPADMPGGNFSVKAVSGASFAMCPLTVTTGAEPDYLIATSPQFVSISPGQSSNVTVYVTSINGFSGPVALSVGSAPGVNISLSPGSLTPGSGETSQATLSLTVAEWASPSVYQINVQGAGGDPPINKVTSINLDIQPAAGWGPSIALSQSYALVGDTITVSGANFPPACQGQVVTIKEAFSNTTLTTTPSTITVNNGSFTGTFIIPQEIPSGNYRIKAIVASTGDFAERDFQIMGTGETFTLSVSPQSVTVTTDSGANSTSTSVNIASMGGSSTSVNLAVEGAPNWLQYQFGTLPVNTPASSDNAVSVPAGGSASRTLALTASMTAPTGTYSITVKGWVAGASEQRVPLELTVQPPAGFGMAQFNLSPIFGEGGRTVNFSGSGFTGCIPSQVTELEFGPVDILTNQSLPTITVPTSGDSAGRFSGTFRVPSLLGPGTYPVKIRVGSAPSDKFIMKPFTITGSGDTFVLQASPSFLWAEQGSHISTMINVQAVGSSSPTVNLALEGLPPDITASFTSGNVTPPPGGVASTNLDLNISNWLPAGHYSINVSGQLSGGAEVHRTPLEMDVVPPAGFGMSSIYLSPTVGLPGTWITISGNGFAASTNMTHLYFGSPGPSNDLVASMPPIATNGAGALTAVLQVPAGLTPGVYPVEVVVGTYPDDKRANAQFTLVGDQSSFSINLSPMMIQAAPGGTASSSISVQSVGNTSTNVTLRVDGPPTIEWRLDGGEWQVAKIVTPDIGSTVMSNLEIRPKLSTSMGHYSLAVKAIAGQQEQIRNLEMDVGASAAYGMPIFSVNPNNGTAGITVSFSGSNFPADTQVTGITFSSANITLSQAITTSPQGSFSGAFTVPSTVGGQALVPGTYMVRAMVGPAQAEAPFNVYGSDDTFTISLSPNFLQGEPGSTPAATGIVMALGGASPSIKMAVKGLPPGVATRWNGTSQMVYGVGVQPGGQSNFELMLVLPTMIPMGQYPANLEGWVDSNSNNIWDTNEIISRVNLQLSVMPPQGYGMGMLSLTPGYGRVGDIITFAGSGFPAGTPVQSLTFAQTNVLTTNITTSADGSLSGVFTVPGTAFGNPTGPGRYPVDVVVGTSPNDRRGGFDFEVVASNQKFSVTASPGWLARPAGDTGSVSISVRSLVSTPPSPTVIMQVQGLPMGVTPSFTSANVTPPVGNMESRELRLTISGSCPMGKYPISIRAHNAAAPAEEVFTDFTLEITPSSGFMDMGMAMVTISPAFGAAGSQITVSGYGFPKSQNLTSIRLGPDDVTPSVSTNTDAAGAFTAMITVPALPSGTYPMEVNVQNTIRMTPFNIMGDNDTYSLTVSPSWLEPIPAGDPNGRQIAITVQALAGKTPTVALNTEGLFAAFGTITEVWDPVSRSVAVSSTGGSATATLTLKPSADIPPGPYPFNIVGLDGQGNQRSFHMEFMVGPPSGFMGGTMGVNQNTWNQQWQGTEWASGVFFPEVVLSPRSGSAGTQVAFTGTNLPANAAIAGINFAGHSVPMPAGGLSADANGGFSGSFVVDQSWSLPPGGYMIDFRLEKDTWSQTIGRDFNLMRTNAAFSLEATPDWLPPIPAAGTGQTRINVKALGYNSANVTLGVMETFGPMGIPGGAQPHWGATDGPSTTNVTVPSGSQTAATFYLQGANPGHYMITIVGWLDSNSNQIPEPNIPSEAESVFTVPLDFDVQPPQQFMTWDKNAMMSQMGMASTNMYLFYFPETVLSPNVGQAGTTVNIKATNFPASANVTHLRFAGVELPVPGATAADNSGGFTLVFNVPQTMWSSNITSGWYDVEVEAQKAGEPPISIRKPFQVTSSDVVFTLKADPDWLPPIPPNGNGTTLVRVMSVGSSANVTLSVDKIPPGVTTAFSSTEVAVTPGGSSSATLTLTPIAIPPGHYGAEIKGIATIGGSQKTFYAHLEFEVQPPQQFMTWDRNAMMDQMGMASTNMYLFYFPEITLNPNTGQAGNKVTISATAFPASANVTHLRFAGMEMPVPAGTVADNSGAFTLVFNVPTAMWNQPITSGWYDVQVEAQKTGEPPVSIMKSFQVTESDVAFTLRADPNWLPPIPPDGNGTSTIFVSSPGAGVTVILSMDKIPPGVTTSFSSTQLTVPPGGSSSSTLTLTPTTIPPGHYGAEIKGTATVGGTQRTFYTHLEFEVQPPQQFMTWDRNAMMNQMGISDNDKYLLYFPEITLNPNVGQAGTKVTISATNFPASANLTHLRFAGMELPAPAGTAADNNGAFTLIFNVPRTIWGGDITSGWYDVQVEAQKEGEPPVSIIKLFQVTASDVAFTLKAEPDWLPPIPPAGSTTTIMVKSMGASANVTLSVDKIPPGITTSFSSNPVTVTPGGSGSATLTLTPTAIPPGHYGAEIKGTATVDGTTRTIYTHLEFEVQPPQQFKDANWMTQSGIWFPEITLNPSAGPARTKVTIKATDFPSSANVTHLRFAGRELPMPANTTADNSGNINLVFNVPGDFGIGSYMVEVEAQKAGIPPVFIAKPFFVQDAGVSFNLNVVPGFVPGVPQGDSGNTTIFVESTGQAVNVQLFVDGLPPGVTANFDNTTATVPPGGSSSTRLTITTTASTPPGQYPLTIRGFSGAETRMMPFGFGIMPPASFHMPKFTLNPDYAPAGYTDKKYTVAFSGTGFPANRAVSSLNFGSQSVAMPDGLNTDASGSFNGVFQMPTGLDPGTYDVRVAVAADGGGFIYDSRPFTIKGAEARFILKPSPPYLPPILQGGQGTTMVTVQSVGTTSTNVTLYIDGLAPGITAAFTPSNTVSVAPGGSASATLTLSVAATTSPGPYPLSIRGTSGSEMVFVPLGFGVMPDIGQGEGHATMTINPAQARPGEHIGVSGAGFTSGNTISLTVSPPGAAVSTNITPGVILVQDDGTWATEITVPAAGQVPPGNYIIKASDGARAARNQFNIVPASNADFFLNVSPQFLKVVQGQSDNTTLKLSSKNGFKDTVRFSVGHLAPGVTATFKNAAGTTIGQFAGMPGGIREIVAPVGQTPVPGQDMIISVLVNVDAATPIGPYDIALETGSGAVFRAIPLGLMVVSTGASMVITPMSGPVDTDIRLSGSGFTAGESVSGTFAGDTIATVPSAVTVAPDGSFTALMTAPSMVAGIYSVRVTGAISNITIDRPFSLQPSAVNTFVLYASPLKVDVPKGGSGTVTIKIEPMGGFQSPVALSVSGLSAVAGASSNISPAATVTPSVGTATTATLTINIPADATVNKYPLVITGTSGSITQTRNVTLNVVPPVGTADFGISLAPNTVPITPGASANTTVTITAINGFAGSVDLTVAMSDPAADWPASVSYTAGSVTPSATTGMGKLPVMFTVADGSQPGNWTFRVTGTSGALVHSTEVMVIGTPAGTTVTTFASPRLDTTTVTASTPVNMTPPWGDRITINGIINDGAEASVITPAKVDAPPSTLANLPQGAADMLGRVTNVESSAPVDGVQWDIGFPFSSANLTAAGFSEENLKVAYLDPGTGTWTEVSTVVDTTNKIAYASPTHFSSWTLIARQAPPQSPVVASFGGGGGGGGSGISSTSLINLTTATGKLLRDVTAQSVDNKVRLTMPKDTLTKNRLGDPLLSVSIKEEAPPGLAPAGSKIVALVYEIGPAGANFDPPVNLRLAYNKNLLPDGAVEEGVRIATWDGGKWVEVEGSVANVENQTVTAPVRHFSTYTVIARTGPASFEISALDISPSAVNAGETVTIQTTVANSGGIAGEYEVTLKINQAAADTRKVTIAGLSSQKLTFEVVKDEAGSYEVDVNGQTGTFTVKELPVKKEEPEPKPKETATPSEEQTAPGQIPAKPGKTPSDKTAGQPEMPTGGQPGVSSTPTEATPGQPVTLPVSLPLIIVLAAVVIVLGLVAWQLVRKRT